MRAANYSSMNIFNKEQVQEINSVINGNLIKGKDDYAGEAKKTSDVKFLYYGKIHKYLNPFIDFCITANNNFFGFDLHPLTSLKKLNYNSYKQGAEYSWHIDAVPRDTVRDIKLTALLNLSEEPYEGGELVLFRGNEILCEEFNVPGSAIIFPAFTNHKVNKLTSGTRNTLAIWMSGPKFR
jgi:PKHD-type hydroxylase|tara:strand:- start:57 stop:599 length:543 start_codon:yes stop_codon:yes gene_type:complete